MNKTTAITNKNLTEFPFLLLRAFNVLGYFYKSCTDGASICMIKLTVVCQPELVYLSFCRVCELLLSLIGITCDRIFKCRFIRG